MQRLPRTPPMLLVLVLLLACSSGGLEEPASTAPEAVQAPSAGAAAAVPPPPSAAAALSEPIPLDPAVTRGTLDNGLTYYIRTNRKPEERAELRLVINAGSVLEDDEQRGLAHFVEHMAFNGTENFEKQELVDYLERIGMRFGPDVNAYTSFDETVYMLQIPTDDEEIVATAFQILEEWAHKVSFEDEEIDKERGVVIEEWRLGRGAWGRIRDRQVPVIFHGSRYAERLPIGEKEILQTAPYDALRRFYREWYRPDLMAVVAVGDFDPADIERRMREHFGRIRGPEHVRQRDDFPIPDHEETLFSVVTDPEATGIRVRVAYKRPPVRVRTIGDARQGLVDDLYDAMLIARLGELAQQADPPFQRAFAASGSLGRTKAVYQLDAVVRDGGVERGLETLLTEAKRVEAHGFLASELERAKTDLLRGIEKAYEERDKQESGRLVGELVLHFLEGEAAPGIEYVRDLFRELVPGITLEEINARAEQWLTDDNRVVLVSGPDTEAAAVPEERALAAVFSSVESLGVTPWRDRVRDEPLVASVPVAGRVVGEATIEELDVTRWQLSNGVTVLLKPTELRNDEVLLSGYSAGGHSLVADADFWSATLADGAIGDMGLGNFSSIELDKALTGKVAGASTYVSELAEGVRGSASPQDLETMFQLVYLGFTAPRRDEEAFQGYLTRMKGWLENQQASPRFEFNRRFSEIATQDHPRRRWLEVEHLDEVRLDTVLAVYRDRFADASDFLFTLVGNFELDGIRPLVETWLGGLPATDRDESWRDVGVSAPQGVVDFEVVKGIEPQSSVRVMFHGEAAWSPLENHLIASLADVLRFRLREVLREDLGGVYGVGVSGGLQRHPRQRYRLTVSFSCDPERVDELLAAVFAEIETLRTDGPDEEYVRRIREIQARKRETDLQENWFWLRALEWHERHGLGLADINGYDTMIEAVTAAALHERARRHFDLERYVQGILVPEVEAATAAAEEAAGGELMP